ncbi:MAG TPA: hypothetical protein VF351_01535 [Actinomycetota bacterium]
MKVRSALVISLTLAIAAGPNTAWGAWGGPGTGTGFGGAVSMPTGSTPTPSITGRNVGVSWAQSLLPDSTAVNAYVVKRYNTLGVAQTIGSSCSGNVSALTCTEAATPPGVWTYTVTPKHHQWFGSESAASVGVTVAAPSLTLTPPTALAPLPGTLAGAVASFATGETIVFRLDDPSSGTILSGSVISSPIPFSGASMVSVTIPVLISAGSHTVYAIGSAGSQASATFTVTAHDVTAPVVASAVIAKSTGGIGGYVRQGGQYYVYANVTDQGSPSSGLATVTANVSTVTTGATTVALVAGAYTVEGVSYSYRSALQTASNPVAAGSKAFTVTATDVATNTVTQTGFSATVDNTVPSASNVQTVNGGGTAGRAEAGDQLVLTFSEPMDPYIILAGWTGASTAVTIRLTNVGAGDTVQVWNGANTAVLPLGTVALNRTDFTTVTRNFTSSTMTMSGSTITITLGTPSGAVTTAAAAANMTWTPVNTVTDRAGNACSTAARTEVAPLDLDF